MKLSYLPLLVVFSFVQNAQSSTIGFADTVIEYFDSGNGSLVCPYAQGGSFPPGATSPTCVSFDVVLGDDSGATSDYISLSQDSFITVGFDDEYIVDGSGDDIFISEVGNQNESAFIYVVSAKLTTYFQSRQVRE